ncbi:ATP-binding protein [Actinoplanes sp. NPDC049681]|uniref:ATP-binding protein n=1 Tax=Actinoplanes sp. NPDC049681 TaxID=3363905 RepID=UPI0037B020EA
MDLAERLVELRTARGLSQEQLAERSMVGVRTIGDLERGTTRRPQRETARALADALELTGADRAELFRLARSSPPAVTRRAPRRTVTGLAAPVSSLVGRDADATAVARLTRDRRVRLVTVTGPGGVGKSRLVQDVGWRLATGVDGVAAVDLSPLSAADDVLPALAAALGSRNAGWSPVDAVAATLGDTRWLLILDSFEHVLGAAADLAALLVRCPRLTALVTSRTPLSLRGEHLWPLAPLPVPEPGDAAPGANPAVRLLVERTAAVRPGFVLTDRNAADVVALCRRLDGLPLAIELAAAQLRTREPGLLLDRLDLAGPVDLPDRQRTLRRAVEWSTERLTAADRHVLGVLAVFAGGAAPSAVRAVTGGGAEDASIAVLAASSLVGVVDAAGEARVTMLDTIREVAADQLTASGTEPAVRRAHARYFLQLLPEVPDRDHDNLRVALSWVTEHEPEALTAELARGLTAYHLERGRFAQAYRVLGALAAAAPGAEAQAWALHGAAVAANESGAHDAALTTAQRCAELFAELGNPSEQGTALTVVGNAQKALGRYADAERSHTASLEWARAAGDRRRETIALNNLGTLAHDRGAYEAAIGHYTASLAIKHEIGDARGTAVTLLNLGGVENDLGRYTAAVEHLTAAAAWFRDAGASAPRAFAQAMLAEALLGTGDLDAAETVATEALDQARTVDYRAAIGLATARLGDVALARGDHPRAATLLLAALDDTVGPPEQARTLDRLATAVKPADPQGAARFAERAETLRRQHDLASPPPER